MQLLSEANGQYIWVTGKSEKVLKVHKASGTIVSEIQVEGETEALAVDLQHAWVARDDGRVLAINKETDKVDMTINVGGKVSNTLAVDPSFLWVAVYGGTDLIKIDKESGKIVAAIPIGEERYGIVVDGQFVWVCSGNKEGESTVKKISRLNNSVVAVIEVSPEPGRKPYGLGQDADFLWVALYGSDKVLKISKATSSVVEQVVVGKYPHSIAVGRDFVWGTCYGGVEDRVFRVDLNTNESKNMAIGEKFYGVSLDDGFVWVAHKSKLKLIKINTAVTSVEMEVVLPFEPICFGDATGYMYDSFFSRTSSHYLSVKTATVGAASDFKRQLKEVIGTASDKLISGKRSELGPEFVKFLDELDVKISGAVSLTPSLRDYLKLQRQRVKVLLEQDDPQSNFEAGIALRSVNSVL